MAQNTYTGEFLGIHGTRWKIEIIGEGVPAEGGTLTFAADPAAELEWKETEPIEPVCGAALTLHLISESDRQFLPLYTTKVGAVRCNVYRNGDRYWTGILDTEQYEEPYSTLSGYEVSLTFSDFAALDRVKWNAPTGYLSLQKIIETCIDSLHLRFDQSKQCVTHISTMYGGQSIDLTALSVDCANFYDEDGEPQTCLEVLKAVLQPFALRIIQRGGDFHIYDYSQMLSEYATDILEGNANVYWDADDQTLGMGKVYNKVTVTLSQYVETNLLDGTIDTDILPGDSGGILYMTGNDKRGADNTKKSFLDGFKLYIGTDGTQTGQPNTLGITDGAVAKLPIKLIEPSCRWMRIKSIYSGSDCKGILAGARSNTDASSSNYMSDLWDGMSFQQWDAVAKQPHTLFTVTGGRIDAQTQPQNALKLTLDVMFDVRYNPFEGAALENEEGNWGRFERWLNFAYIPVKLELLNDSGAIVAHYMETVGAEDYKPSGSGWQPGAAAWGDFRLSYYDWTDRKSKTGMGGWATNKTTIGCYKKDLPANYQKRGDGVIVKWPDAYSGTLRLTVGGGVFANTDTVPETGRQNGDNRGCIARWLAYKDPRIVAVQLNGKELGDDVTGDIVTAAWLDKNAADDTSIDLTVGSAAKSVLARGGLRGASSGIFTRNGHSGTLQELLCGTVFSQHATPSLVLTGQSRLLPIFGVLTDANSPGRAFMPMSEVQDLRADTSDVRLVEVQPEDYTFIEYTDPE